MRCGDYHSLFIIAGFVFECKFKTRRSHCVVVIERPHVDNQVDIAARGDMAVDINVGNCFLSPECGKGEAFLPYLRHICGH